MYIPQVEPIWGRGCWLKVLKQVMKRVFRFYYCCLFI